MNALILDVWLAPVRNRSFQLQFQDSKRRQSAYCKTKHTGGAISRINNTIYSRINNTIGIIRAVPREVMRVERLTNNPNHLSKLSAKFQKIASKSTEKRLRFSQISYCYENFPNRPTFSSIEEKFTEAWLASNEAAPVFFWVVGLKHRKCLWLTCRLTHLHLPYYYTFHWHCQKRR